MTSWDTTAEDVERFAAGVVGAVDQLPATRARRAVAAKR
jgi:hypothetical protein